MTRHGGEDEGERAIARIGIDATRLLQALHSP